MRLSAIEAIRYGGLVNGCVKGLGDGLTVILGPNESGKSSLTALTRHVLYGYPDGRSTERRYVPTGGPRHARLLFVDEAGEWAIERVDGSKRGPVSVSTLRGTERPGLLGEIVGGVSEQTYQVVFGFGLDELSHIESGDKSEVVASLYAAGTGLGVNPLDVRKQLEQRASELWAPGAQKRRVNALSAEMRALKETIRDLESQANAYAAEQQRAAQLADELEPLRAMRDELDTQLRELERALQRASEADERTRKLSEELSATDRQVDDLSREAQMIDVDEGALAQAEEVAAVLAGRSGFEQRRDAMNAAQSEAAEYRRQVTALGPLPEAGYSAEARTGVERHRDALLQLRSEFRQAEQNAEAAEAQAAAVARVSAESSPAAAPTSNMGLILAIVAVGSGIIAAAAGALTGQWIAVGLGAAITIAGVVVLLTRKTASAAPVLSEETARLRADAVAKRELAAAAQRRLSQAEQEWRAWLAEHSLDSRGDDPVAVLDLLETLRDRARLVGDAEKALAAARREQELAEAWVERLAQVASIVDPALGQMTSLDGAIELAARLQHAVNRAVEGDAERRRLRIQLDAITAQRARVVEQLDTDRGIIAEVAKRFSAGEDPIPELQTRSFAMQEQLSDVRGTVETLGEELHGLRARLDTEGRDARMALARQQYEGLRAQAEQAADQYAVHALSVYLLDRARERYERERQPEVLRTAARIFEKMTDGRFTDLRLPLDGSGVSVISEGGRVFDTSALSRGTAEQLYLALRVGLIGSLGEMGQNLPILMDDVVVNFDPARRAGAVTAVGELAAHRQVIYFTCHPDTAQELTGSIEGSVLLELDRCSL